MKGVIKRIGLRSANKVDERIISAVALSIKELIHYENFSDAVATCLWILGKSIQADGVYLYVNHYDENGNGFSTQKIAWDAHYDVPRIDNPRYNNIPFRSVEKLIQPLLHGQPYHRFLWDQWEAGRQEFRLSKDVLSTVLFPVTVNEQLWGVIGFDESKLIREWSESVYAALGAFAHSIERTIERDTIKEELTKAKHKAEESDAMKGKFIANMSHEIRTPMNAILGYTALLEDMVDSEKGRTYIKATQKAGKMLVSLIDDILDLSKIESGKQELHADYIDIREVLHEIKEVFTINLEEKNLSMQINVSVETPEQLIQDETHIRQILIHLIGNAAKFTEHGTITVLASVSARRDDADLHHHHSLKLEITDTGIGIPTDQQISVFEPFKQLEGHHNGKYGGAGLGLTITKKLVEEMGGQITLSSKEGEGTTVTVFIPLMETVKGNSLFGSNPRIHQKDRQQWMDVTVAKAADFSRMQSSVAPVQMESATLSSAVPRILVVDDVMENLEIARSFLEKQNYAVFLADSGLAALGFLEQASVDLILMDVMMPDMDGYQTCTRIKSMEKFADIPVVFLSAKVDIESITRAFACGAADYIHKPYNQHEFLARIKAQIDLKRSRDELEILATTDPETMLSNQRDILNKIEYERMKFERKRVPFSIIFAEIDDFERISMQNGLAFRDQLLKQIAGTLKSNIRKLDFAARWGPAVFSILLPETSATHAEVVSRKLKARIDEYESTFLQIEDKITMTICFVTYDAESSTNEFTYRGEQALYQGWEQGGNCILKG